MASMPMQRLVLTSSIPVMFSLSLQAVYNIVDSAFVSNMDSHGEEGLNALTLAFPVHMFIVALCIGTGVGASVLVARYLGERKVSRARLVTTNTIFMGFIITAIVMLFGYYGAERYIHSQTDNPIIREMAIDYLQINCLISFGAVFFGIFEKLLQATGHSLYSTAAQVTGAIVNMVLDPILIFGVWCIPAMGVQGAAYATVFAQTVAFLLAYLFHRKFNKQISDSIRRFKPSLVIIKQIYIIGFPAIVAQALLSMTAYGLNVIFVMASEGIVTVYGLYYKIQQFVIMLVFGLRDATMPIISFNYGMKNQQRLKQGIFYLLLYTVVIMLAGTVLFEIFATDIAAAFGLSGESMKHCIDAIQIISFSFVFVGFNVACQGIFQAVDSGSKSLIISLARQVIFVLPVAYFFTQLAIFNLEYTWTVWLTFIVAEVVTFLIAIPLLKKDYKTKILS